MQSSAAPASPTPSSFAGFLAALAQPDRATSTGSQTQSPKWSDELLAEDVATLSYEQALRTHARYHADDPIADPVETPPAAPVNAAASVPEAVIPVEAVPEKELKDASITIRLSREENAQLRKRASEAGLTVSAYIRSCTFEAEALRALVKDALAQLRTSGASPQQEVRPPNRRRWSALFWPGRRVVHHNAPNQT